MEIYIDEISEYDNQDVQFGRDYDFSKTIACGSFGIVKTAKEKASGQEVAVKIISKSRTKNADISKTKQEVTILKQLNHPNIVGFINFSETNSKIYIVTEYLGGGTLKHFIDTHKELEEEKSAEIIFYLLQAVSYLHSKDICHHDIKPENIMFKNKGVISSLKLLDFGLSSNTTENKNVEFCGTLLYMAPELFDKNVITNSKAVDIWSVGIITAMLLNNGKHPFFEKGENKRRYIQKIKSGYRFNKSISEMGNNFIKRLLEPNSNQRYTVTCALQHPWITRKILDNVPLTLYENLVKKEILSKFKDAFIAMIILNRLRPKKESKFTIGKDYISKIKKSINEQRLAFEKKRTQYFKRKESEDELSYPCIVTTENNQTSLEPQKKDNATKTPKTKATTSKQRRGKSIAFRSSAPVLPSSKVNVGSGFNKPKVSKSPISLVKQRDIKTNSSSKRDTTIVQEHHPLSKNKHSNVSKNSNSIEIQKTVSTTRQVLKIQSKFASNQASSVSPTGHGHMIESSGSANNIHLLMKSESTSPVYKHHTKRFSAFPTISPNSPLTRNQPKFRLMEAKIQSVVLPKLPQKKLQYHYLK